MLSLDPVFDEIIRPDEIQQLQTNRHFFTRTVEHYWNEPRFSNWYDSVLQSKQKRGEIVLVIQHEETVLLHTKSFYPAKTWRLLSGGVHYGEDIVLAAMRELYEETGFATNKMHPMGAVFYRFRHKNRKETVPFASYLFWLCSDNIYPQPQDDTEDISGFKWIPYTDLIQISKNLNQLQAVWKCWGAFRAIPHKLAHHWLADRHNSENQ